MPQNKKIEYFEEPERKEYTPPPDLREIGRKIGEKIKEVATTPLIPVTVGEVPPEELPFPPGIVIHPKIAEEHPVSTTIAEFASGLTTPANLAPLVAFPFIELPSVAAKTLASFVGGAITADSLKTAYDLYPEIQKAANEGDTVEVERLLTKLGLSLGTAALVGIPSKRIGEAAIRQAGREARERMAARSAERIAEAKSGKIIDMSDVRAIEVSPKIRPATAEQAAYIQEISPTIVRTPPKLIDISDVRQIEIAAPKSKELPEPARPKELPEAPLPAIKDVEPSPIAEAELADYQKKYPGRVIREEDVPELRKREIAEASVQKELETLPLKEKGTPEIELPPPSPLNPQEITDLEARFPGRVLKEEEIPALSRRIISEEPPAVSEEKILPVSEVAASNPSPENLTKLAQATDVEYKGEQKGFEDTPGLYIFNDNKTGSAFAVETTNFTPETYYKALADKRKLFKVIEPEITINPYHEQTGKSPIDLSPVDVDKSVAARVADAYDDLVHNPNDPKVKEAYNSLIKETKKQWDYAKDKLGMHIEVTENDPYSTAEEMIKDIVENRRIKVWAGEGDMPADHPLRAVDPETGLTYNTLFRAVHDIFGHAAGRYDFSEVGEQNAFNLHKQSYSEKAVPALATETLGQASWFFNNKNVRTGKAELGTFPTQKAALLPKEFYDIKPQKSEEFVSDPTNFISEDFLPWESRGMEEERKLFHVTTNIDKVLKEGLKSRKQTGVIGLGGGPENTVSVTYDPGHASVIAERLRLAVKAAREELTPEQALDIMISNAGIPDDAPYAIAEILGAPTDVHDDWEAFFDWFSKEYPSSADSYEIIRRIDDGLPEIFPDADHITRVGFVGSKEDMAKLDPEQIDVLEVKAKKGSKFEHVPEEAELRFRPEDVKIEIPTEGELQGPATPISEKLREKFGETPNPSDAAFILPDGSMIKDMRGMDHQIMINTVRGVEPRSDDAFDLVLEGEKAIRIRRAEFGKMGEGFVFSVPSSGVTPEQVAAMKKAISSIKRGFIAIEPATTEAVKKIGSATKEFATAKDVDELLKKLNLHPGEEWSREVSAKMQSQPSGAINPISGKEDTTGVGIEIYPEARQRFSTQPSAKDIELFYEKNKDMFEKYPELRLGWDYHENHPSGKPWELNIGAAGTEEGALLVGKKLDQRVAFDIERGEEIPIGGENLKTSFKNYPLERRLEELSGEAINKLPKGIKDSEYLTREEKLILASNKSLLNSYRETKKNLPSPSELASAMMMGERNRFWYDRAIGAFKTIFDLLPKDSFSESDRTIFTKLIAATSPRVTPSINVKQALSVYQEWVRRGRPLDRKVIEDITAGVMKSKRMNIARALKGAPLSGPKVSSFEKNLTDNPKYAEYVTNDMWNAITNGIIDPKKLTNEGVYIALSENYRKAAKKLGWTPAQGQAASWGFIRTLGFLTGGKTKAQYIIPETINTEIVQKYSADIADIILTDAEVRNALLDLGIDLEILDKKLKEMISTYEARPQERRTKKVPIAHIAQAAERVITAKKKARIKKQEGEDIGKMEEVFQEE